MQKMKVYGILCALMLSVIAFTSSVNENYIVLKDEPLQIIPEGFYVDAITDERVEKAPIAIMAIGGKSTRATIQNADFQGGAAVAVSRFVNRNLKKDVSQRPVIIGIKTLKLIETILPNGGVDGRIQLSLNFGQTKEYGTQQLVAYSGGLHYTRALDNSNAVESHLRAVIKSGLVYFNNWMHINIPANPNLAKAVSITFTDYSEKTEGDTIYYSPNRPLKWDDFQSRIRPSGPFNAMVMPNFGYNLSQEVKNGIINVCIEMKTFTAKSDCWVGGTRNAYALNHEQRHFDIARIITRQYQQKIRTAGLTPDTYEAFINMQYLDSYRDMNALQKAYDKDTRHGLNEQEQLEWNKKIDSMLRE